MLVLAVVVLAGCSSSQSQWELGCEADSCGDGRVCVTETIGTDDYSWCTVPCSSDAECADVDGIGASRAACVEGACQLVDCSGASVQSCPEGFACAVDRCVPSP
jgi:hypothetical protein